MDKEQIKSVIESILFTMGEAVELDRIAKALEMDSSEVKTLLDELIDEHNDRKSGIRIIEIDGSYQMCTPGEAYEYLIRLVKIPKNYKLTDIQLETLSIIAYKQPVTKLEIEKIRGVKSDFAVNKLIEYGLIEEAGRLNAPGKPILFKPTDEFYRRFGVENTASLPQVGPEMESRIEDEVQVEVRDALGEEDGRDNKDQISF